MSSAEAAAPEASDEPIRADVVVLGASFAGIEVVLQLRRRASRPLKIVVVDRQRGHGYLPLVHERMSGRTGLDASTLDTAAFLESLPDTRFVEGEIVGFDPATKIVHLADGGRVHGRFVVVALGSVVGPPASLPGREHVHAYKLGPEFARTHAALRDVLAQSAPGHVVVIGGGISGVELAGDLAHTLGRGAGDQAPKITLVTSGARLVPELPAGVGRAVARVLKADGVELRLQSRVVGASEGAVELAGAEAPLRCDLAIWAAGVSPAPVLAAIDLPRTDDGWLAVGPTLQCFSTAQPTHPDVFACGDAVRVLGGEGRWPTMQRAIECLWQAKVVAINVLRLAAEPPGYPEGGPPPLSPHRLRRTFFYGVSAGAKCYVVYRGLRLHVPGLTPWFRRWLMRRYFARYTPLSSGA